jgi:hypothetical protein
MLTYGNLQIDETRFPPAITERLLSRAVSHILGNEVASAVLAWQKRQIVGKDGKIDTVTDSMLESWRQSEANLAATATREDELRAAKVSAMYDGTLAVRVSRAPSRDPVEVAERAIAKAEIVAILKANKLAFPKKDETIELAGTVYDADALIDARLVNEKEAPRIHDLAVRKVREDKRLREAVQKGATATAGDGLAASLGL